MLTPQEVKDLLIKAGCPEATILFPLAQACFESGSMKFDSQVAELNNNLTGIIFLNASWQHNCVAGIQMPLADTGGKIAHYAKFETPQDWALDFHRILHLQTGGLGRPIEATTIEDYVHRLKANYYFGGTEATYLAGLESYILKLNEYFNYNQA